MHKLWLAGRPYQVTAEQKKELDEHIASEVVPDADMKNHKSKGTRPKGDSEKIALEWMKENEIDPMAILLVLIGVALMLFDFASFPIEQAVAMADSFSDGPSHAQLLLAALTTGAGVNTPTSSQSQVEQDIMIGDIDTAPPIRGLKVNIDGDTPIDIQGSQVLVQVFAKLGQPLNAAIAGVLYKISTGRIKCNSAVITFTNDGATTPAVYWNSQKGANRNGRAIRAQTQTINPNSNTTFMGSDFAYLAITDPANVTSFDFTFGDGTQQNMTVVEADGMFAKTNETEANGRLAATATCIDNTRGNITSVKVNVGGTAVIVMNVK